MFVCLFVCLFVLRLKVPVNKIFFSHVGTEPPLPGYYHYFRRVKCLAQGHNTAEVGFEPPISRSRARRSTTDALPLSHRAPPLTHVDAFYYFSSESCCCGSEGLSLLTERDHKLPLTAVYCIFICCSFFPMH